MNDEIVKESCVFWNDWLCKESNFGGQIVSKKNSFALYEAAFRAYLQIKNTCRWFLCVECDENDNVKFSAMGTENLHYDNNENMKKFLTEPVDPKYFLLVFKRNHLFLVFKKVHNYSPYLLVTHDIASYRKFKKLCGNYKFSNCILKDD
jgi:hypothetical protein